RVLRHAERRPLGARGVQEKALALPVLARQRPPFVVAPAASDLQIARREPLELEAGALDEPLRAVVPRLDVRLDAVELQLAEDVAQDELEPLRHQALARVRRERVVAEVRALEKAVRDLAQVVRADERA